MANKDQVEWLRTVIGAGLESLEDAVEAVVGPLDGKSDANPLDNGTVLADAPTGAPKTKPTTSTKARKLVDKCPPTKGGPLTYKDPRISGDAKSGYTVEVPDKKEGPFKTRKEAEKVAEKLAKEARDEMGDSGKTKGECIHKGADWIY